MNRLDVITVLRYFYCFVFFSCIHGEIQQTSKVGEVGTITYDLSLKGSNFGCTSLAAGGTLTSINVSMTFSNGDDNLAEASDMFITVADEQGNTVDCIVFGGYYENVGILNQIMIRIFFFFFLLN